tara:strand:+ start:143 stop:562 length:420 start_codon:yes stop_codon:yes gene_type:complete
MFSFSMVLLEEGVDMELPIAMSDLIPMLDGLVPEFTCEGHEYQLGVVSRAKLGSNWDITVNLVNSQTKEVFAEPVGSMELESIGRDHVNFRVPPRSGQKYAGMSEFDWDGKYFGSFIYQMLNSLHERQLIKLPGLLPQS